MTNLRAGEAVTGTGDRSRPRAALPALCATQITSWGVVYYAFPVVLNPQITAATGWSATLLQATAVTDRWDPPHYGHLSGLLGAPATIASALAPFAGAALTKPGAKALVTSPFCVSDA